MITVRSLVLVYSEIQKIEGYSSFSLLRPRGDAGSRPWSLRAKVKKFVFTQPDIDWFEYNQQQSYPDGRGGPLTSEEERRVRLGENSCVLAYLFLRLRNC